MCRGPLTYSAELPGTQCGCVRKSLFVYVEFSFDLGGREGGRAALYVGLFSQIYVSFVGLFSCTYKFLLTCLVWRGSEGGSAATYGGLFYKIHFSFVDLFSCI